MFVLTEEQKKAILSGTTIQTDDPILQKEQEEFIRANRAGGPSFADAQPRSPVVRETDPTSRIPTKKEEFLRFFGIEPVKPEEIRRQTTDQFAGAIDVIEEEREQEIREQREKETRNIARLRGLNVAAGLAGTPFAGARKEEVRRTGEAERGDIRRLAEAKILNVMGKIDQLAFERIEAERETTRKGLEAFVEFTSEEQDRLRERGVDIIEDLGSLGTTFEGLQETEEGLDVLNELRNSGFSDLEIDAKLNRANEGLDDANLQFKELKDGTVGYFNPTTGTFKQFEIEGGLRTNEELKVVDGVPYAMFTNEEGNLELRPVNGFTSKPKKPDFTEAKFTRDLRKEASKLSENFREARRQLGLMEAGLDQAREVFTEGEELGEIERDDVTGGLSFKAQSLNAPSQAILVTFQKILDPTSVVRESEYARSSAGESLIRDIQGRIQGVTKGGAGVTLEGLEEIVDLAKEFLAKSAESMKDDIQPIVRQAESLGLEKSELFSESILSIFESDTNADVELDEVDEFLDSF